jgi:hypothetical protein
MSFYIMFNLVITIYYINSMPFSILILKISRLTNTISKLQKLFIYLN